MSRYFTPAEARAALFLCALAVIGALLGALSGSRPARLEPPAVSADSLAMRLVERDLAARLAPVKVNRATVIELTRLEGIGPALAGRIVAERENRGPYREPGDLAARVAGIGPATVARLSERLDFSETGEGEAR